MSARVLAFALLLACGVADADERILAYEVDVAIGTDGGIDVTERITVRAEGVNIRRGIYRDFPTRYEGRFGRRVNVGFDVIGVERDGRSEPWFIERLGNGVRINTGGDALLPVPAEYTYTLRYHTTRQLGFFGEHDELYFNAIGTGWVFPIMQATVFARLPREVAPAEMQLEAYTGHQGARGRDYTATVTAPGVARWTLTRMLNPQEGMTIVLSFPKGIVASPNAMQQAWWSVRENLGILIVAIGFITLLGYCARRWYRIGRDPRPGTVFARYEPPPSFSAASLGYLARTAYDMRCFTADVLALAVSGHLEIERDKGWFRDTWTLSERKSSAGASIGTSAWTLMTGLFSGAERSLTLSRSNAKKLQAAREAHERSLRASIEPRYLKRNQAALVPAILIAAASALGAHFLGGEQGDVAAMVALGPAIVVIAVFAALVKAPTAEGRELLDAIEGFKLYLAVAEGDELAAMPGPDAPPRLDAERYERLLPYAVALDVEDAWTEKFTLAVGAAAAAAAVGAIGWYHGGRFGSVGEFSSALGSGLNSSIASSATPPGSSSGGGGGGSSGGGGGGGGGGGR